MPSLYAQYVNERIGDSIIESDIGWATYRYMDDDKTVYIVDIYIVKESRNVGEASRLADEIVKFAKVRGCSRLIGSVVPSAKGSTASMRVLLGYGMSLCSSADNFILFEKEI